VDLQKPPVPQAKTIDREAIQKENRRLAAELWQQKLTPNEKRAVNNLCFLYGLDPLQRQLLVLGGNFYITVAGLKKVAEDSDNPPEAIQVIPATREERELAGIIKNDPSKVDYIHFWKATLYKKNSQIPYIEFGEASESDVNIHGKQEKDIRAMARTRATGRALRNAYSIGLPLAEEAPLDLGVVEDQIVEKAPPEPGAIPESQQTKETSATISEAQGKRLWAIAKGRFRETGVPENEQESVVRSIINKHGFHHTRDITRERYDEIIREFQNYLP